MILVVATRLRLRSGRYLLLFLWHAWLSSRQAKQAAGNLGVVTHASSHLTFWTISFWQDEAAMKAYRNTGTHRTAMPKLARWCDQAKTTRWYQAEAKLPSWREIEQRLAEATDSQFVRPSSAKGNA